MNSLSAERESSSTLSPNSSLSLSLSLSFPGPPARLEGEAQARNTTAMQELQRRSTCCKFEPEVGDSTFIIMCTMIHWFEINIEHFIKWPKVVESRW